MKDQKLRHILNGSEALVTMTLLRIVAQAADWAGLSALTIRRRIADGTLPASNMGDAVRIAAVDLLASFERT